MLPEQVDETAGWDAHQLYSEAKSSLNEGGYDRAIQLFEKLLERGISIAPGPMFSASQRYRNCMRISVGHPWTERTEKALAEVGRLARQQVGEPAVA